MAQVNTSRSYDVPADAMWERIGDFETLDAWHPALASCEVLDGGARRKLTTVDGGEIYETLTEAAEHSYSYTIDDSPLPVADYTATLSVAEASGGSSCTVVWVARFTAAGASDDEAEAVIKGIFDAGLDAL